MPGTSSIPSIKPTGDGSTTLYSHQFGQHYHNPNGAVAESRCVFFETPGIPDALAERSNLHILEIGFGTGLNLILLLDYLQKSQTDIKITFSSVEAFPVDPDIAKAFDFGEDLARHQPASVLAGIFESLNPGMNEIQLSEHVFLKLYVGFFNEFAGYISRPRGDHKKIDVIFHDPFSPEVNAELWTPDVFRALAEGSDPDAILSTYCAATSARAAMAVAGWKVARAKGALGKREMTVASLNPEKLKGFKRVDEERLIERYERDEF